jgi:hypothetical protein
VKHGLSACDETAAAAKLRIVGIDSIADEGMLLATSDVTHARTNVYASFATSETSKSTSHSTEAGLLKFVSRVVIQAKAVPQ